MENFACVHNTFYEHDIFANKVFLVKHTQLSKLWTPRGNVHVGPWSLETIAVKGWLKRLNNVLPMVLICKQSSKNIVITYMCTFNITQ